MENETKEEINEKEASAHTDLAEVDQMKLVSSEMSSYDAQRVSDSEEDSSSFPFIHLQKLQFTTPPLNSFRMLSSLRRNNTKQNPFLHRKDFST